MSKEKELLNRSAAKGRKNSKKANLTGNKKRRKSVPYGAIKKFAIDSEEDLVGIVNKKKERQKNKLNPNDFSIYNDIEDADDPYLDITTTIL